MEMPCFPVSGATVCHSSSVSFTQGSIGLYQIVATRPDPAAATVLPATREAIYARAESPALAEAS